MTLKPAAKGRAGRNNLPEMLFGTAARMRNPPHLPELKTRAAISLDNQLLRIANEYSRNAALCRAYVLAGSGTSNIPLQSAGSYAAAGQQPLVQAGFFTSGLGSPVK